jgi:hypothetical protein
MAILSEMVDQLQQIPDTVLSLAQVQRTAYHRKRVVLTTTALVSQMRETVRVLCCREDLDETTPFTLPAVLATSAFQKTASARRIDCF